MNRWTIKELRETDDITFAMLILSERRETLNQEAPLAKKLRSAYHALDDIRGGMSMKPDLNIGSSIRELIYREKEREYLMDDIKIQLEREELDLHGLTPEQVLADGAIIAQILHRFGKCETDRWENVEYAVETGIKEVLENRKKDGG